MHSEAYECDMLLPKDIVVIIGVILFFLKENRNES